MIQMENGGRTKSWAERERWKMEGWIREIREESEGEVRRSCMYTLCSRSSFAYLYVWICIANEAHINSNRGGIPPYRMIGCLLDHMVVFRLILTLWDRELIELLSYCRTLPTFQKMENKFKTFK